MKNGSGISRRTFLGAVGASAGITALVPLVVRAQAPPEVGTMKRELPTNVYRVDASGRIEIVISEEQLPDPNGLAFAPDYKKLYVISTGPGPGIRVPAASATCTCSMLGPTTRCQTSSSSATSWSTASSVALTACAVMSMATSGCRAMATPAAVALATAA